MADDKAPAATPPAATDQTPTADAAGVFSLTEKYLQKQIDSLTGADGESASMRGALTTALAILRAAKPGGSV